MNLLADTENAQAPWLNRPAGNVIAAFGEIIQDVIAVPTKPLVYAGGHVDGDIVFFRGGCAANVAAGCAQSGAPTRFIGHSGADGIGERLVRQLEAAKVNVVGPIRGQTASSLSIVTPDGDTAIVFSPGGSRPMRAMGFVPAHVADVGILHLNSHHLYSSDTRDAFHRLIELARGIGALISLDVSAANRMEKFGVERYREELRLIRPEVLMTSENESTALDVLVTYPEGVGMVLVHRGSKPTLCLRPDVEPLAVPVTPVPNVVDTTGAGDAFAAGFLSAGMEGVGLTDSIVAAHSLAAQTIVRPGVEFSVERTFRISAAAG